MAEVTGAIWRKSSRSGPNGATCVEVARNIPGQVFVRDSKDQSGPILTFAPAAWSTFVATLVRSGRCLDVNGGTGNGAR